MDKELREAQRLAQADPDQYAELLKNQRSRTALHTYKIVSCEYDDRLVTYYRGPKQENWELFCKELMHRAAKIVVEEEEQDWDLFINLNGKFIELLEAEGYSQYSINPEGSFDLFDDDPHIPLGLKTYRCYTDMGIDDRTNEKLVNILKKRNARRA